MSECLFCRIVAGDIPAKVAGESDTSLAFFDIAPQAPVHVLVIPKVHLESANALTLADGRVVDDLILLAQEVVHREGVQESGYRLVFNVGEHGQMTVPHLHMHVLGGRQMNWPPG